MSGFKSTYPSDEIQQRLEQGYYDDIKAAGEEGSSATATKGALDARLARTVLVVDSETSPGEDTLNMSDGVPFKPGDMIRVSKAGYVSMYMMMDVKDGKASWSMFAGVSSWPETTIYIDQVETDPAKKVSGCIRGEVLEWIRANSHPVVAKKTADGEVTYCKLSRTDRTKYFDGTDASSDITQYDVFMKMPDFWYRGTEGDKVEIHFRAEEPSDPNNWVKWDGNTLIGVYEANYSDGKLKSISGVVSTGGISYTDFTSYAAAKGTGYQLVDWEMQNVMAILFYAWYGNTNCQEICGSGNNSTITESGQTNILGMTDTTSENGNSKFINFWGLENWWGSKSEWMQDVHTTGNGEITVDTPKSGGESRALSFPQSVTVRYPNKMKFGKYCDCIAMDNEGSDSSGYCDYQHSPSSAGYVAFRSYFGASLFCGLVYLYAGYDPSGTSSNRGARLAFRGVSREAASVSAFQALQEA